MTPPRSVVAAIDQLTASMSGLDSEQLAASLEAVSEALRPLVVAQVQRFLEGGSK